MGTLSLPELKANIDRLGQVLESMYSDNRLCQVRPAVSLWLKLVMKKHFKERPHALRLPTDSMLCLYMKARLQRVITGPTSTTTQTSAG